MASQVIGICGSRLLLLLLFSSAGILAADVFLLFCQLLASLLHLLLVMSALCSAVPFLPPPLSVLLVFYLNPNMLPHDEEAPQAIFIK